MILLQIQHENNFLPTSKHRQAKFHRFLGIFFVRLLYLSHKFRLPKMARNETPSWLRSQNSEEPRIFWVTGANQNARKLLFTDLVNTKDIWFHSPNQLRPDLNTTSLNCRILLFRLGRQKGSVPVCAWFRLVATLMIQQQSNVKFGSDFHIIQH